MAELSYPLAVIAAMAAVTVLTRALPFLALERLRDRAWLQFLSRRLPSAVLTLLLIYVLRDVTLASAAGWLPETLGVVVTATLQFWTRNPLISIAAGTVVYALTGNWLSGSVS
jgi:branched-subunit amino acid transport protein AzlD